MTSPKRRLSSLYALCLLLLLCTACDSNRVYETNQPLDGEVWPIQKTVRFSVNISDTVSSHALLFNVRNSGRYAYSNLYTYLTTEYPDNRIELDTLEFVLAAPDGKWLGSGLGDIYDNQILFARNVRFPVPGEYTFEFVQGMRVDQLTHLLDVGLRIEREE